MLRLTVRREGKVHVLEFSRGFVQNRIIETVDGVEVSPMKVTATPKSAAPRCTFCPTPKSSRRTTTSTTRSWPSACAS
jgi:DNA gyrase subunit B